MPPPGTPTTEAEQKYYDGMVQARRKLVTPLVIITLIFFFVLQILTNFTSILDGEVFYGMTWAYVYAFAQFLMVIILTTYYQRRMDSTERALRPAEQEQTAAHYEDPDAWEKHEAELEQQRLELERLERSGDDESPERTRP